MSKKPATRLIEAINNEPWLITEGALHQIQLIAARAHDTTPEAISKLAGENQQAELVTKINNTAILNIRGPMARYSSFFSEISGMSSTEKLASAFSSLDADESVEQIILQIDSPGGTVNGIAEFAELIASGNTPTVSYITGVGASAAYWVASQTDKIYVSKTAITGSIGVRGEAPDEPDSRTLVSKYAPAKIGSAAASQAVMDRLEVEFHNAVASGRGVTATHVQENFGQGGVFVGSDAVDAGLADAVATLDQILAGTVGMPPVRRTTTSSDKEESMTTDTKTGGITTAEHEKAVAQAKAEGIAEGNASATDTAITEERARVSAILEAGQGKAQGQVKTLIDKGIDAETAGELLANAPDIVGKGSLDARMTGTNPSVSADDPVSEDDEPVASWGDAMKRAS